MEKSLRLFQVCFDRAFKATQGVADYCMITYEDLRQDCWLAFDRTKGCIDEKTYIAFITWRLIGAIKQYQRNILKTRTRVGGKAAIRKPNISLDDEGEIIEPQSTENADYFGADLIIEDVMSNGLLTKREKMYFSLSFIEGMKDKEISDYLGLFDTQISFLKKKVCTKLMGRYTEKG